MRRAFGVIEGALALVLIALAVWGVGTTLVRRAVAPPWLQPITGAWT